MENTPFLSFILLNLLSLSAAKPLCFAPPLDLRHGRHKVWYCLICNMTMSTHTWKIIIVLVRFWKRLVLMTIGLYPGFRRSLVQLPAQRCFNFVFKLGCQGFFCIQVLNTFEDADCTMSLGNLVQCLTILTVKGFLYVQLYLSCLHSEHCLLFPHCASE